MTSNRAVQKQIEHERKQGKVILSSTQPPGGYFLPETKQENRLICGGKSTKGL
jgi:biotin operon repressor